MIQFAELEQKYQLPEGYLARTSQIESSNNPRAKNKSGASGQFQFMPKTAKAYGLADPYDPLASAEAAARLATDNKNYLLKALGREPEDREIYLAHQQGMSGAANLLTNPDKLARNIVGTKAVVQNGGNPNMTAAQFSEMQMSKYRKSDNELDASLESQNNNDSSMDDYFSDLKPGKASNLDEYFADIKQKPSLGEDLIKSSGAGLVEGIAAPFTLGSQIGSGLVNLGIKGYNAITGKDMQGGTDFPIMNLYEPETTEGQYVKSIASSLPLGGITKTGYSAGQALKYGIIPSIASEASGQATKGTEAEPYARAISALLAAGISGPALDFAIGKLKNIAEKTGLGIQDIVAPFTKSGQQKIVGETLNKFASNPSLAAANMMNPQEIVPGSVPTAAEAAGDYGIAALQKAVKNKSGTAFAERLSEQNAARNMLLDSIAKEKDDLEKAVELRDKLTKPLRERSFVLGERAINKKVIATEIDSLSEKLRNLKSLKEINSPLAPSSDEITNLEKNLFSKAIDYFSIKSGDAKPLEKGFFIKDISNAMSKPQASRESVERALKWVSNRIGQDTNPRNLYSIRQDINDAMQGKFSGDLADLKLAKSELKSIKNVLDNYIEQAAPGFKNYLSKYESQSTPINQMQKLQDIKSKVMYPSPDIQSKYDFISQPKWSTHVQKNRDELTKVLSPSQLKTLDRITADLDRGASITNVATRVAGSDTSQNQTMAYNLGLMMAKKIPFARHGFEWMEDVSRSNLEKLLVDAMLNPKLAAQLMMRATPKTIEAFSFNLGKYAEKIGITSGAVSPQLNRKKTPRIEIYREKK